MDTSHVAHLAQPLAAAMRLEVYDVEQHGNVLRVSLVGNGEGAVDVDALESVSRSLSVALDEANFSGGAYMLEVSSPGVERRLRTPRHFETAVGEVVTITTTAGAHGRLRFRGQLLSAGPDSVTVLDHERGSTEVPLNEIDKARTIFEWGPTPKPGGAKKPAGSQASQTLTTSTTVNNDNEAGS